MSMPLRFCLAGFLKRVLLALFASGALCASYSQELVSINPARGIRVLLACNEAGPLRVDVVDKNHFGDPDRPLRRIEIAVGGNDVSIPIPIAFDNLEEGSYGVRAFIDRNGDGRLNRGPFGPTEPWALSWVNGRKRGIPRFQDIAYTVESGMTDIKMNVGL
jgi:uncharacterized protein (DUF2141 family)